MEEGWGEEVEGLGVGGGGLGRRGGGGVEIDHIPGGRGD